MRKISIALLFLSILPGAASQADPRSIDLPSVEQQLARDRVVPGSALEQLILENQDFHLLRAAEAGDKIPVPLWLRDRSHLQHTVLICGPRLQRV